METTLRTYTIILFYTSYKLCFAFDESRLKDACNIALGMQSGRITDSQLDASSSHDYSSVGPSSARIRSDMKGGAWCPRSHIDANTYEWLQIDLRTLYRVTAVEVQGRFGGGQGTEFAEGFRLQYQRRKYERWKQYKDQMGLKILKGNANTYTVALRKLFPPIVARRIRFVPFSLQSRMVCMRVEVMGCPWTTDLLEYEVRQGDRRSTKLELLDFTYDGLTSRDGKLSGGLGQLADYQVGVAEFRKDKQNIGIKAYEWIGWRTTEKQNEPLILKFIFNSKRNFSSVAIHSLQHASKDIAIFKKAELSFDSQLRAIEYQRENISLAETTKWTVIPLSGSTGSTCHLKLYFTSKWILISEIVFNSSKVIRKKKVIKYPNSYVEHPEHPETTTQKILVKHSFPKSESSPLSEKATILLGSVTSAIVLLVLLTIVLHKHITKYRNDKIFGINNTSSSSKNVAGQRKDYGDKDVLNKDSQQYLREAFLSQDFDTTNHHYTRPCYATLNSSERSQYAQISGEAQEICLKLEAQFCRENVKMVEILGKGDYYELHLCQDKTTAELNLVAMKVLSVCSSNEPIAYALEYPCKGNLIDFKLDSNQLYKLSFMHRISFELSSALAYMEHKRIIHGDIACRNVYIGAGDVVKLCNFAKSITRFKQDYCFISQNLPDAPLRWMSWEALRQDAVNAENDVWAFGVTLWEIYSRTSETPYQTIPDNELITSVLHKLTNKLILPHNPICPKEVYDLITACTSDFEKPRFQDIGVFFENLTGRNTRSLARSCNSMV